MQLGRFEEAASLLEDAVATAELVGERDARGEREARPAARAAPRRRDRRLDERGDARSPTRRSRCASRRATTSGWRAPGGCSPGSTAGHAATEPPPRHSSGRSSTRAVPATCARSGARRLSTRQSAVYGPTPVDEGIAPLRGSRRARRGRPTGGGRRSSACSGSSRRCAATSSARASSTAQRSRRSRSSACPSTLRPCSFSSGRVELLAGDAAAAERELRRGYDYFSRLGERYLLSSVAGLLAEALGAQGRLDEAEALSRETEALAAEDDVEAQTLWRSTRAKVLASPRRARRGRGARARGRRVARADGRRPQPGRRLRMPRLRAPARRRRARGH